MRSRRPSWAIAALRHRTPCYNNTRERERERENARDWSNEALSVRIPRPRDGRIHHDNESALSTSASASLAVRDDDDDYDDDDDDDDILVLVEELIELGVGLQ